MAIVRIVIGETSGGIYWEGVNALLRAVDDFDVMMVKPQDDVTSVLERTQPHVLIIQSQRSTGRDFCQEFWSIIPDLAIIGLEVTGAVHILQQHAIGRDLLVDIIRDIGEERNRQEVASRSFVLITGSGIEPQPAAQDPLCAAEPLPQPEPAATAPAAEPPPPYRSTAEHLHDFFLWLDLVLLAQLAKQPARVSDGEAIGWAMQIEKARSLLAAGYPPDWTDREYDRARVELESWMQARAAAGAGRPPAEQPGLIALGTIFKLDPLEWLVLVMALAAELDGRYARVFGYLNDDLSRKRPTASLIAHMLPGDRVRAWRVHGLLRQSGRLADYQLLTLDPEETASLPGSEAGLVPAAELVAYLLAGSRPAPRYLPAIQVVVPPTDVQPSESDADLGRMLQDRIEHAAQMPVLQLPGGRAQRCWFERLMGGLGYTVIRLDVAKLPDVDAERIAAAAIAAARVALLHNAALLMTGFARLPAAADAALLSAAAVNSTRPLVHVLVTDGPLPPADAAAPRQSIWRLERPPLTAQSRAALWCEEARRQGFTLAADDARHIARTLAFDAPRIAATLSRCPQTSESDGPLALDRLKAAARQEARQNVPPMVRRIETVFDWPDLVLPDAVLAQLKQVRQHVAHAEQVLGDWGFARRLPYGQGVAALFSGASGTGKTMAAQIIARDLGVELFQVDLAKTMSKYIGDTEKNLDVIFDAAEESSAVLLFDEADSLFGRRSEVKDAHDRYANVEVSYLLQRMEAYTGVAILTTNMKQNLDAGFIRRLRFCVEFPFPAAEDREKIWERSFPAAAPGRDAIDFNALARRLAVTGGHIQQIAVHAAFAAAAEASNVRMRHILEATRYELTKLGMLNAERSLADLAA